jgi:hypothetical protein
MPILDGMATDYGTDSGAMILGSIITKGVFCINDVDEMLNPIDLHLATNGDVVFTVGGGNDDENVVENLTLTDSFKEHSNVYNFKVEGPHAIALSPNDPLSTVYIGDAVISSTDQHVKIGAYEKKLAFETDELVITGPFTTASDAKVQGNMFAKEYNVTRTRNNSDTDMCGYSFRINSDEVLELIKYDTVTQKCQLVAHFGKGFLMNDPDFQYSVYGGTGGGTLQTGGGTGDGTAVSYWHANGNDIYFSGTGGVHYVGINTSNPTSELDVVGTTKSTVFTDGSATLTEGRLTGLLGISVSNVYFPNNVEFNGHASGLHGLDQINLSYLVNDMTLADFAGHLDLWYDRDQSGVLLSGFSNDIVQTTGLMQFDAVAIASNLSVNTLEVASSIQSPEVLTGTLSVQGAVTAQSVDAPAISTASFTTETVNATSSVTADSFVANTSLEAPAATISEVTASKVSASADISALNMTAIQDMIAQQVQAQVAVIMDTLYTSNLHVENFVKSDLIPQRDIQQDLGSATNRWRDLYLSGNTLVIDNVSLSADSENARLVVEGGEMKTEGVIFNDDTVIRSMNEIGSMMNPGDNLADFDSFAITINTQSAERITGSFTYDRGAEDIVSTWSAYYWNKSGFLPINSDGTSVDMNQAIVVAERGNPKNVKLNFFYQGSQLGDNVYLTSKHEVKTQGKNIRMANINQMHPIRTLDPYSDMFRRKMKADFHNVFNKYQYEAGYKNTCAYVVTRAKDGLVMCELNDFVNFNSSNPVNGTYVVDVFFDYAFPRFQAHLIENPQHQRYLIPNSVTARLNHVYTHKYLMNTYELERVHDDYGMYPSVGLFEWSNSANEAEFRDVIYSQNMGWGTLPAQYDVYTRYHNHPDEWLKELFKRTYLYIKYGDSCHTPIGDAVIDNLDTVYGQQVSAYSITFVNSYHLDGIMENSDSVTNTRFVLSKATFEDIV